MGKVVIIMGSKSDLKWSKRIAEALDELGIESALRIASAHKAPLKCYELIKECEKDDVVFITVAGRSNALSGFTDAQTCCPVSHALHIAINLVGAIFIPASECRLPYRPW